MDIEPSSLSHQLRALRRAGLITQERREGWVRTRALLPQASDYRARRRSPKRDILAGVTVAFVALPPTASLR